jgi:hypothetical protein
MPSRPRRLTETTAWSPITAAPPVDNGLERTVTGLGATEAAKFYRVGIEPITP